MPSVETDVDKLFLAIRENLEQKGMFEQLRTSFETARERHRELDSLIHNDTKNEIREYIEKAGFAVEEWHDKEYADAVVVVKARKKE